MTTETLKPFENSQILEKSRSIPPDFVTAEVDLRKIRRSALLHVYGSVINELKSDGENVLEHEAKLHQYLGAEEEDDEVRAAIVPFIESVKDRYLQQYDKTSDLAFFDSIRSRLVRRMIEIKAKDGKTPNLTVVVFDMNYLHNINTVYGDENGGDAALLAVGHHIRSCFGNIAPQNFSSEGMVTMGRQKGTGDEFVVAFLENDLAAGEFLKTVNESNWPLLSLVPTKSQDDLPEEIVASARYASARISTDLAVDKVDIEDTDPGVVLNKLIELAKAKNHLSSHERTK